MGFPRMDREQARRIVADWSHPAAVSDPGWVGRLELRDRIGL